MIGSILGYILTIVFGTYAIMLVAILGVWALELIQERLSKRRK